MTEILDRIDQHFSECAPCRQMFHSDDDYLDPCPALAALYDEHDEKDGDR